ncbi:hypothetical protein D3C80_1548710 [compost metagenome]
MTVVVLVSRRVSSTSYDSSGLGMRPACRRAPSAIPISWRAAASSGFASSAALSAWVRLRLCAANADGVIRPASSAQNATTLHTEEGELSKTLRLNLGTFRVLVHTLR